MRHLGAGVGLIALLAASACGGGSGETAAGTGPSVRPSPPTPSATSTPTPTSTTITTNPAVPASPESVSSVDLVCGDPGGDADFDVRTVPLAPDGTPNYEALWALKLTCDQGYGDMGVSETMPIVTPLQKAVVAAAHKAGYSDEDTSDDEVLYSVYQYCGSNDPDDAYMEMEDYSEGQVAELKAWMTLCPKHPQAATWRQGIAASAKAAEAERNGTRVYDGTYKVPSEMKRGTFVVKDVEDCYWETRDANGRIIDNDFIVAAPSVVATVRARAVVFTAEGCGQWNKQ